MDVLVTGAHGLIASALIPRLRADGHRVVRLVRGAPEGSDDVRWDPAAGTIDAAGIEGVDAVVHLAGAGIGDKKWTPARKQLILDSRTQGTDLLARTLAGLTQPPKVLLSGSAVGYYGDQGDHVLVEESPAGDDFPARVCVAWEAATVTGGAGRDPCRPPPHRHRPRRPRRRPPAACSCPSGSDSAAGSARASST